MPGSHSGRNARRIGASCQANTVSRISGSGTPVQESEQKTGGVNLGGGYTEDGTSERLHVQTARTALETRLGDWAEVLEWP